MIIRIMGEGQLKLEDSAVDELNKLDADLEKAVEGSDEAAFGSALSALLAGRGRSASSCRQMPSSRPS